MAAINPITEFYTKLGRYPGNNKQWWLARAETDNPDATPAVVAGDFRPDVLDKLFSGNNRAPRGHFVLNAFSKDRSAVSGVTGIPIEETQERPPTVAFFSGRAWFACNSNVYFSQVLTAKHRAGLCYQEADPTAEDISDIIATDGGYVPIPEAGKIIKLLPNAGGMIVFATNGVWNITGTQSGFSALDISVNKVSPIGCRSPMSVVESDTSVFWWSDVGILGMTQQSGMYGPIPGAFEKTNITESTIQTLFNDIPDSVKEEVKAIYDYKANSIIWLYRDSEVGPKQYNRMLILDLSLNAFYPWKISQLVASPRPYVKGLYVSYRLNDINTITTTDISPTTVEYTAVKADDLRFCQIRNTTFVDWKLSDGTGIKYNSYVETGYELFEDAMRKKAITYLFSYMRRTEGVSSGEGLVLDDPSSCFLRVKWDWASSTVSNKWTVPVQIYRQARFIPFDTGAIDTGFPIVVAKNKVRGNGKAIQFRFGTDEPGRNFDLHGWSIAATGSTTP